MIIAKSPLVYTVRSGNPESTSSQSFCFLVDTEEKLSRVGTVDGSGVLGTLGEEQLHKRVKAEKKIGTFFRGDIIIAC